MLQKLRMLLPCDLLTQALVLSGVRMMMFKVLHFANELKTFLKIEKNTQIDSRTGLSLISKVKQNLILLFHLEILLNRKGEKL